MYMINSEYVESELECLSEVVMLQNGDELSDVVTAAQKVCSSRRQVSEAIYYVNLEVLVWCQLVISN